MTPAELNKELGNIDLYLLDQILKGRFSSGAKIIDIGSGEGRNLIYFLQNGYNVYALDQDPIALQMARMQARTLGVEIPADQFIKADSENIPFQANTFDAALCISVLHFSGSREHFRRGIEEIVRVAKNSGIILIRTNCLFGIERWVEMVEGLYKVKDGSVRYLMDKEDLNWLAGQELELLEPPRWEVINDEISQINLVMQKG